MKSQIKLVELKNAVSEMKSTLDELSSITLKESIGKLEKN
jgi:hypothetical protein